jgi:hypothetical protein
MVRIPNHITINIPTDTKGRVDAIIGLSLAALLIFGPTIANLIGG